MSKSRVCIDKSVKLVKHQCVKTTNLLVYEKNPNSKTTATPRLTPTCQLPGISKPKIKHFRVCTGSELKKICPPIPCECPPRVHITALQRLLNLLKFGLKSLAALGLVYITTDLGIWGDSETTERLYKDICEAMGEDASAAIIPTRKLPPSCLADKDLFSVSRNDSSCGCYQSLPTDHNRDLYRMKQTWNKGVNVMFASISGFPYNLIGTVREKFQDGETVVVEDEEEECEDEMMASVEEDVCEEDC